MTLAVIFSFLLMFFAYFTFILSTIGKTDGYFTPYNWDEEGFDLEF